MKKVLIIHGWGGSDEPHWQAKLAQELVLKNVIVAFPTLPNRDFPKLDEWKETIEKAYDEFNPQIVVCHSLGCIAWLQNPKKTKKLFLVAPPSLNITIPPLASFFDLKNFDTKSKECYLFTSSNDKYLSTKEAANFAEKIKANHHIILQNAGHINSDSGFGKWDEMLKLVLA
ncbi:MAG: RBBP9/YdeN family alpha/beta hydrolase [Campylobacteraceae bacterium]